jgi:HD-GYP domain-containing protein (c-di-GMP phosphodiesterase class II)
MGAIGSILMMEGFEPNERMKMISKVLDGLKAYFGQVFQVTQKAALPVRVERPKVEEREEETVSEEQVMQKSADEEIHEPVEDPTGVEQTVEDALKSEDATDDVETEKVSETETIKASFEDLRSEIEALKAQLKELEELRASVSEISEKIQKAAVPPTYRQSDDVAERKTKKQSVFKGVFQL